MIRDIRIMFDGLRGRKPRRIDNSNEPTVRPRAKDGHYRDRTKKCAFGQGAPHYPSQ